MRFCMTSYGDSKNSELVDKAGQSILNLLHKAADAADQNSRHAVEAVQGLSQQLQAARDRIAQLESDLAAYQDRAERSESWLDRIRVEIEQKCPTSGRKPER
jgi:predicted  nucleic acid-binding Zn-ribbon protein